MTKALKNANKNDKLAAYALQIANVIDARDDTASANVQKSRVLMLSVAETLMSANYNLEALKMNVHTINTKDHDIACVLSGKKAFLDHQTRAILKTAIALETFGSKLTNVDTVRALDCNFKAKTDREKQVTCITKALSVATIAAQSSQVRNTLANFGILKLDGDKTYSLNVKNKNYLKLAEIVA